ncbi:hypothetical protein GLOTRDRAFT_137434 [Gloeophyllum trabeum ATCC 11539]|uniref:BTB domain-containing protein n=1 Tax=Gloeophyllum trabeum (strain ATCC 11539 / FP-39264 / Madison 617) TaxID=670483 RepID=S7RQZ4_GLOTA|nr:uncharacterized protein GLOTRDRAFT_137434 [Gloeophyllum trabeum ATCC 11539]EPQ56985.1 hypothetical protein GLOTRDRAFT_137434 [Gloeophyllum trabeum ATCC 11539]
MSSNHPPHILIARNSRSTHAPSASLSSPTETHAAAAGIFRASGSPPWHLEECDPRLAMDDMVSELSIDVDDEGSIDIDETFTLNARFPGTVKIIVEGTTFWAHKEVLVFASPFFEAALSGNWAETEAQRPHSISSTITVSHAKDEIKFAEGDPDLDHDDTDVDTDTGEDKGKGREYALVKLEGGSGHERKTSSASLNDLSSSSSSMPESSRGEKGKAKSKAKSLMDAHATERGRRKTQGKQHEAEAVIVLKEEKASTIHDFLKFVYPHLQCTITWANAEPLIHLSHKLCHPPLTRATLSFLLSHAAGRPIKALRIAEVLGEEELFREASRFVLDNPNGWEEDELGTLSKETLLKLEKRRTWFLERVLKLGLIQIAKEYECCATCPDSTTCARLLEEKWRQAYQACFRFGPCQPSMVYRYLRTFEGISPPLSLTHLSCQTHAKAFVATLFDRMFSLGQRGSGTEPTPLRSAVGVTVPAPGTGPRRHFLYCTLKSEQGTVRKK